MPIARDFSLLCENLASGEKKRKHQGNGAFSFMGPCGKALGSDILTVLGESMSFATRYRAWFFLVLAIFFEVGGTSVMKLSQADGWILGPQTGLLAMYALIGLSYYCLALSVTGLPVGVAFAFWEGLGLTLITLVSVFILDETMNLSRFLALLAVLAGAMLIHHGTGEGVTPQEAVTVTDKRRA